MPDLQEQIYEAAFVFEWIRAAARDAGIPGVQTKAVRVAVKAEYRHAPPAERPSDSQTGDVAIENNSRWGSLRSDGLVQLVEQLAQAVNHRRFSLLDKCRRAGRPGWGLVWGSGTAQ